MYHSLISSLKNFPMTSRKSVSSQPLASALIIKFSRKNVGSSSTFPENDFEMVISLPLFVWPLIIHLATILSLFLAFSYALSLVILLIFQWVLGCYSFLRSGSSSLLLLSLSSSPSLAGGIFLELF